jgi:hypothetical protein
MKDHCQLPTLILKKIKPLRRKTNQLGSLFRAQLVIEPPGQKKLRTTVNLEAKPNKADVPIELYAANERGRPKKLISHATLVTEYHYLLHLGKNKLDAREVLARKYGYSNERAVRRITNDPAWDQSHWCISVQTGTIHKPAIVALLDKSKAGTIWGDQGKAVALSGTGWLWIERQKSAVWMSRLKIHAKDCERLYPGIFSDERYVLERFPI